MEFKPGDSAESPHGGGSKKDSSERIGPQRPMIPHGDAEKA
jgi:hypothetical protein